MLRKVLGKIIRKSSNGELINRVFFSLESIQFLFSFSCIFVALDNRPKKKRTKAYKLKTRNKNTNK